MRRMVEWLNVRSMGASVQQLASLHVLYTALRPSCYPVDKGVGAITTYIAGPSFDIVDPRIFAPRIHAFSSGR